FAARWVVHDDHGASCFTAPPLFFITRTYIEFINTFAEINKYSKQFSREVSLFSKTMYVITALVAGYLLISGDVETIRVYLRPVFTVVHLYAVYSVIRAFVVIKSALRYYVLASNLFLISFTAVGLNASAAVEFHEGIYSNT